MLELRLLNDDDISLVENWLHQEHVKRWYEIPHLGVPIIDWMYELKERHGEFKWLTHLIVLWQGRPIGLCQYYMKTVKMRILEMEAEFGKYGWKQLPVEISKRYHFTPAKVEEEEHMVKAPHPKALLHGSPVSPTLAAAIMNSKYVNAVPLYRTEKELERYGIPVNRNNMAHWMIRLGEEYLGILYDFMHQKLYGYHVIQADETPCLVNKDGRPAGSKSYMWVYRCGYLYQKEQIILCEYQKTRDASHPREFLKDYSGICVTDGYHFYHTLEKEKGNLSIAGC